MSAPLCPHAQDNICFCVQTPCSTCGQGQAHLRTPVWAQGLRYLDLHCASSFPWSGCWPHTRKTQLGWFGDLTSYRCMHVCRDHSAFDDIDDGVLLTRNTPECSQGGFCFVRSFQHCQIVSAHTSRSWLGTDDHRRSSAKFLL